MGNNAVVLCLTHSPLPPPSTRYLLFREESIHLDGNQKWVKVFVQASHGTLTIPSDNEEGPGAEFSLGSCALHQLSKDQEAKYGRNFMFVVESVMRKTRLTFAASNQAELERWLKYLAKQVMRKNLTLAADPSALDDETKQYQQMMQQPDIVIDPTSISDDEWNDKFQASMLLEENCLEASVQKGLTISSLVGAFLNTACHVSQTIVYEFALPSRLQTVKKLSLVDENGASSNEELFYHQGLLFRLCQQPSSDDDNEPDAARRRALAVGDSIQHKVAGNELRCTRWAQQAATAVYRGQCENQDYENPYPICSPLSCITDVGGFRFFVMCVPPVEEQQTLMYGRIGPSSPFVVEEEHLQEQVKLICRMMNLKVHYVDTNSGDFIKVSSGYDFQAHSCSDNRGYMMNLSKASPPDLPLPKTNQILTHQLRPEFVQLYNKPLSADAFRVEAREMSDAIENDEECIDASTHLRKHTLPAFVAALDALSITPTDSYFLSKEMHARGINMRYLGYIFELTTLPHVKGLVLAEATARVAKHILNQATRTISRKARAEMSQAEQRGRSRDEDFREHNDKLRKSLATSVLDFLNLLMGTSEETDVFWEKMVLPLIETKFNFQVQMPKRRFVAIHMPQLLHAIQQQCSVVVADRTDYDFTKASPFNAEDVESLDSKVKWEPNDQVEAFSIASRADQFMASGNHAKALQALNLALSMHNACFSFALNNQSKRTDIMNQIALAYYKCGEYKEAVEVSKKTLETTLSHSMGAAKSHMIAMMAHFKLKQHSQSSKCFQKSKHCCLWCSGPGHPFFLGLYSCLADLFYEEKDYESAALYIQLALKDAKKVLGSKHSLVALLYSKVGILLANRGDAKNATVSLKNALELFERYQNNAEMSLNSATMHFSLAEVMAQSGKFDEAMQYASKAIRTRVEFRSKGHPDVIESYVQVARLYENMGNIVEGIRNYEKALASLKKNKGDKDSAKKVQRLSRKVLSLEVRNQPLSMRTMLQTAILKHPALVTGSRAQIDTTSYVLKMLYVTAPSSYLRLLLEFVSSVNGDERKLPRLPSDEDFDGAPPSPAAQLAFLASLAAEGEGEEDRPISEKEELMRVQAEYGIGVERLESMRQSFK